MNSKSKSFELLASTGTSFLNSRTTLKGNAAVKTLDGIQVAGPPLVTWQDVITLSGQTILRSFESINGRMYGITTPTAGLCNVVAGTFNSQTGLWTYLGRIVLSVPNVPATIHTLSDFRVDDSNVNNVQLMFTTRATGTNATQNGGFFRTWKVAISDFAASPITISMATDSDQKAVYYEQGPGFLGILNLNVESLPIGLAFKPLTKTVTIPLGTVASTWQITQKDVSQTPNMTTFPGSTVTVAAPGKVQIVGHGYSANDAIVFTAGTLPTGLTLNTVYFVRNQTANDFEVSATFGGASITTTGVAGSATVARAFGITSSAHILRTGNLQVLTGLTALLTGGVAMMTPQSGHAGLNGVESVLIGCSSAAVGVPMSEITNGATNIPNLLNVNITGPANVTVAPAAANMTWSPVFDRIVYLTNTSTFVAKKLINSIIEDRFGALNVDWLEAQAAYLTDFGFAAVTGLDASDSGWIHIVGSTAGQRGILSMNEGASYKKATTKIITKVIETGPLLSIQAINFKRQRPTKTAGIIARMRTNLTSAFNDESTGWVSIPDYKDMTAINVAGVTKVELEISFRVFDDGNQNPAQIQDVVLEYIPLKMFSQNWVGNGRNTTQDIAPAKTAFRLIAPYTSPKTMRMILWKDDGTIVLDRNTTTHFAEFSKSSDLGQTVVAMSGANDYFNTGSGNELVIYNHSTTLGDEKLNVSWIEA